MPVSLTGVDRWAVLKRPESWLACSIRPLRCVYIEGELPEAAIGGGAATATPDRTYSHFSLLALVCHGDVLIRVAFFVTFVSCAWISRVWENVRPPIACLPPHQRFSFVDDVVLIRLAFFVIVCFSQCSLMPPKGAASGTPRVRQCICGNTTCGTKQVASNDLFSLPGSSVIKKVFQTRREAVATTKPQSKKAQVDLAENGVWTKIGLVKLEVNEIGGVVLERGGAAVADAALRGEAEPSADCCVD
jgi:hypothetical protein